jgi:hypothetical protein
MRNKIASVLLFLAGFSFIGFISPASSLVSFSTPTALEQIPGYDLLPSPLQAANGTLWVAWQSNQYSRINGRYDVLYKTMTNSIWSRTSNFTTSGWNAAPALAQLQNGTILLVWANNQTGNYDLYYKRFNNGLWSNMMQISSSTSNDTLPSASVSTDGTLWLVWTRITKACAGATCSTDEQLYYKTLKNGAWTAESRLTTDNTLNFDPSIMTAKDRRVWVVWSKSVAGINQIFYKIYDGTGWTSDAPLVTSSLFDIHPSIVQDRNGTIWVFWARDLPVLTGTFQYDIFSKQSYDNGLTWSSDAQRTLDPAGYLIDDKMPAVVQASDKSIYMFYVSDLTGLGADFDIYYMRSNPIYPVHDVTVKSIQVFPNSVFAGQPATVQVTVTNLGDFFETVQLTVQAVNATSFNIGSVPGNLPSGASSTFMFSWDPGSAAPAQYVVIASVPPVLGETTGAITDNTLQYRSLTVLPVTLEVCYSPHVCGV